MRPSRRPTACWKKVRRCGSRWRCLSSPSPLHQTRRGNTCPSPNTHSRRPQGQGGIGARAALRQLGGVRLRGRQQAGDGATGALSAAVFDPRFRGGGTALGRHLRQVNSPCKARCACPPPNLHMHTCMRAHTHVCPHVHARSLYVIPQGRSAADFITALRATFVHTANPQVDGAHEADAFQWNELGASLRTLFRVAPRKLWRPSCTGRQVEGVCVSLAARCNLPKPSPAQQLSCRTPTLPLPAPSSPACAPQCFVEGLTHAHSFARPGPQGSLACLGPWRRSPRSARWGCAPSAGRWGSCSGRMSWTQSLRRTSRRRTATWRSCGASSAASTRRRCLRKGGGAGRGWQGSGAVQHVA